MTADLARLRELHKMVSPIGSPLRAELLSMIPALLTELEQLRAERDRCREDAERLDWLDSMNASLNKNYGTEYGWKLILSPNVVRLMRKANSSYSGHVSDIDLNDSHGGNNKRTGVRAAIDAAKDAK